MKLPIENYKSFDDFLKKTKGVSTLNVVTFPLVFKPKKNTEFQVYLLDVYFWLEKNCRKKIWLISAGALFSNNSGNPLMVFEDEDEAIEFLHWIENYTKEFNKRSVSNKTKIWNDKEDFDKIVENGGPISINGSFVYNLRKFDADGFITRDVIEMWMWMKVSCKNQIYRWNKRFYFTDKRDAATFKLRWMGKK